MTTATVGSAAKMTLEEWGNLPDDEGGEFVDGQIVEDEDVGMLHDVVVAWIAHVLWVWVGPRGGVVGTSDTRFAVAADRGRKPDLFLYLDPRRGRTHGLVRNPPDIAVEVVSPTPRDIRRDRIEKPDEYAAFGVRSCWIVDPQLRTVEIHELMSDGRYARAAAATGGVLAVPGFEGLALELDLLWAETERIPADP